MPPRYAYWTILVDGQPTAFRAAEPDELLPTLKRLQVKQPGAIMKWFERGGLWESREEARQKLSEGYTVGPDGALVPPSDVAGRGRGWRPGGEHRDPREKYQLAKKAKWQKFKALVRARPGHGRKSDDDSGTPGVAPDVTPGDEAPPQTDWRGRPKSDDAPAVRPQWRDKPTGGRDDSSGARTAWKPRPDARGPKPGWKPRPDARGPKPEWTSRPDARGPKPEWRDRPKPAWRDKPAPEGGRPERTPGGARPAWRDTPKPEWRDKPPAGRGGPKPAWRDRVPGVDRKGPRPDSNDRGGPKPAWRDKPPSDRGGPTSAWNRGPKPEWRDRPSAPRGPKPEWRDRGPSGDRRGPRPESKSPRPEGSAPKPAWSDRPKKAWGNRPAGGGRPPGSAGRFSNSAPRGKSAPPRRKKD